MNCGGIENLLMNIYRNINRKYIQFDFLTFRKETGYFDEEIKSLGGKIFYTKSLTVKNVLSNSKLNSFFLKHPEYKIVHAHLNQWCGIVLRSVKYAGIPVRIAHSHTSLNKINLENSVKNIIKLSVNANKYATHRFSCSSKASCWLYGKKEVKYGKINIWPNTIDCDKFRYNAETRTKKRSELRLNDAYTLIHVGRLHPAKNHLLLIDIFDNLSKKIPNSKLLIIGDDQMNGQCQKYASQKKSVNNIMFLGGRSDIAELLQAGDVVVYPSFYEGFPVAVLEAQAAGLPCVISDTITNEVCLTDNIVQLPINKGTDIWMNKIMEFKNLDRIDTYDTLVGKGYDIHALCKNLSEFYGNQHNYY
jgi:glycosyltransferase involved in cell wall biosynthesis